MQFNEFMSIYHVNNIFLKKSEPIPAFHHPF